MYNQIQYFKFHFNDNKFNNKIFNKDNIKDNGGMKGMRLKLKNEFGKILTILTDNKTRNHNETIKKRYFI